MTLNPQHDNEMYEAIWAKARFSGNSHQRRKIKRFLKRRITAGRKMVEHQIEHFFDESPFQKMLRERNA